MDQIQRICSFLASVCKIYSLIMLVRVCSTWIVRDVYQWQQNGFLRFLSAITDPVLNIFKPKHPRPGRIVDYSPLFAFVALCFFETTFSLIAHYGHITLWLVLAVLIHTIWMYLIRYFLLIIIIGLGVRMCLTWFGGPRSAAITAVIDRMLNRPVCIVWTTLFPKKPFDDKKMVITAFIIYRLLFFALRSGVSFLVDWLCRL